MSRLATEARPEATTRRGLPPGPPHYTMFSNMREMKRNTLSLLMQIISRYGDTVHVPTLFGPFYIVNHPDGVRHVLQENNRNYNKDVVDYRMLKRFLGRGLLTDDGESWLRQRRLMQPQFHRQRIAAFGAIMTGATLAMLERWQVAAGQDQTLDIANEMMRLTLRIVGEALFSIDLSAEAATVGQSFKMFNRELTGYFYFPFPPLSVPTPRNRRIRDAGQALEEVVVEIIKERRQHNDGQQDLLALLLQARDEETGQGMDDGQLRDNVLTLMLAGHETTANALAWTCYLLALHPAVEQKLCAELESVLGGRVPAVEDLPNLSYNRMVIEEALRLYPPAWSFTRNALADDEIGGYHIPAGSMILLSPYTTQRHPAFWEDPDRFDPERFRPERSANRPRYAYFPFGGGPRLCIGRDFALLEAQLILATVAQRYRLRLADGAVVAPEPLITLRPRNGLPMKLLPVE